MPASFRLSDFPDAFRQTLDRTLVFDYILNAPELSELDRSNLAPLGIGAMMSVPLRRGPMNVIWSITAISSRPRRWKSGEVALLEEATERIWAAMQHARAETSLRDSEQRLQLALTLSRLSMWDWDMGSNQVAWSPEHYRMQGYAVGEVTPSYEAWLARVHPEDRAETEAALVRARNERKEYLHTFRSLHPDGKLVWLAARGRFSMTPRASRNG